MNVASTDQALRAAMGDAADIVNGVLDHRLPRPAGAEAQLTEAMRYAVFSGGKRLRPVLVMLTADLFAVPRDASKLVGAAVELIHSYSLIHDDLPCMDDDDLRRGQPTVHRKFDEATAVLAGDGLQTLAFEMLAGAPIDPDPNVRLELLRTLAAAAGAAGMCAGQMIDLRGLEAAATRADIERLQALKTGALIKWCCEAGAILGHATPNERSVLEGYGEKLGFVFQITDDLLDAEGTAAETGKNVAKDADAGKATLVALLGAERARAEANDVVQKAVRQLDLFGERAALLRSLARFVVARRY